MYQHPGPQYQPPQPAYNQGQYPPPQQGGRVYGQQPPYQQYSQQPYQQPYNQGYQHVQPSHGGPQHQGYGPPPKKKGNPVITRYAPPPGYRGPAAQGGPTHYQGSQGYTQQGYLPQPGYGPPQNSYPPQTGYQQPPSYPPQQGPPPPNWQQHQNYHWQQGYQHRPQQGYDLSGYQQHPYPPQQGYQGQSPYLETNQQWHQQPPYPGPTPPQDPNYPPSNGYTPQHAPQQALQQASNRPPYQQPAPTPPQSASASGETKPEEVGWDYDYYGEPWANDPDSIDPDLSIGIIVWHPANPTTRALPSTFAEAEKDMADAVKQPDSKKRKLDEQTEEPVSKYFAGENAEEALLNVRQTSEWPRVRHDLIFVEFPRSYDLIPMSEVKTARDRPDIEEDAGSAMDIEEGEEAESFNQEPIQRGKEGWNVMDNLELALSSSDDSTGNKSVLEATTLTTPAAGPSDQSQFQPLQPVRDTAQEDILAQLGVSGSPKPVYPTPGPAKMPPRQDSLGSQDQGSPTTELPARTASVNGTHPQSFHSRNPRQLGNEQHHQQESHPPPPPPEPEKSPEYDPWKVTDMSTSRHAATFDGASDSPGARSNNSQHTLVGSDFHPDGDGGHDAFNPSSGATRKPSFGRTASGLSRKRSHNDEDDEDTRPEQRRRQHDDVTPRLKRKQPKVDAAYGRRW